MLAFNIFELSLVMLHKIAFACSPINKPLLKCSFSKSSHAYSRKLSIVKERRIVDLPKGDQNYLLWSLRHPFQTAYLIKRYHMVGNSTIVLHLISSLILVHLCIKLTVFIQVGDDKSTLDYFESRCYPHLAFFSKRPSDYDWAFLAFSLSCLSFRFKNLCELIKQAIINTNTYQELNVPQLNFAYMSTFNFTPIQWLDLWKKASIHRRAIQNNEEDYKNHLEFGGKIHSQLYWCYNKYSLYNYNFIDFEECYTGLDFIKSQKRQPKRYRTWHTAYPIDRISLIDLQYVAPIMIILSISSLSGFIVCFLAGLYRAVSSHFPEDHSPSLSDFFWFIPIHSSKISNSIRVTEVLFLFFCQLPQIYESMKVVFDVYLTASRARKLVEIFRLNLTYCRSKELESIGVFNTFQKKPHYTFYDSHMKTFKSQLDSRNNLNERILRDVKLTRLIHLEFLNIKKYHSTFLNMLVLTAGISMPIQISTIMKGIEYPELIVISLSFLSSSGPLIVLLLFCAQVEKTVSIE